MSIILIILVNILFYYKTLKFNYICDDIPVSNQDVKIPKGWWMLFWYHWMGRKYTNQKLAHIITLGIHTINCVLIYLAFGHNLVSLLAALLFAVNPVNNQGSIWISGKGYSTNLTCALLMWMFPVFSPIIYMFGTYFCGASLIFMPLVFIFTPYWPAAFLVIPGMLREYGRIFNKKDPRSKFNTESNKELLRVHPGKIIIALKTYGYHFINALFALRLGYYHKYCFLHGVCDSENKKSYKVDKYFFIGLALALTTIATRNIYLIWFTVGIMMWCNFVSFNQTIANRYTYIPNAGLMLLVSSLFIHQPLILAVLFTYYAVTLSKFLIFYKNEYYSIEYSCLSDPDFFYHWQNRAVHCFQNNNYHGALANMTKANELRPNDWKITYNISQIYMALGNLGAAKHWYEIAQKCGIDGREKEIGRLMERLKEWMDSVEAQAKSNNNQVDIDLAKFDMQR